MPHHSSVLSPLHQLLINKKLGTSWRSSKVEEDAFVVAKQLIFGGTEFLGLRSEV